MRPAAGPIARREDLASEDHGKVSNLSPDDLEALRSCQKCLRRLLLRGLPMPGSGYSGVMTVICPVTGS